MADFNKRGGFGADSRPHNGGFRGFGGGFGGRSRFNRPGNRDSRQAQMFSAICSACQKPCEVPFRPSGDKPVYCSYCFGKNKAGGSGEAVRKDFTSASNSNNSSIPVSRPAIDGGQITEIKKQLDIMNSKIDKLMEFVAKHSSRSGNTVDVAETVKKDIVPAKKVTAKKSGAKASAKKK